MDLSHETYVHPSSIGQHEIVEAPIKTILNLCEIALVVLGKVKRMLSSDLTQQPEIPEVGQKRCGLH